MYMMTTVRIPVRIVLSETHGICSRHFYDKVYTGTYIAPNRHVLGRRGLIIILYHILKSNLPTAVRVQTSLGGSPHRGRIAAPTVPYDRPLGTTYPWYD